MTVDRQPFGSYLIPAFRTIANLEAFSWAGLLSGMLLKYVITSQVVLGTELVTWFGRVHGGLVVIYVALAMAVAAQRRWKPATTALAFFATIPPFATVIFDVWAHRTGKYRQ